MALIKKTYSTWIESKWFAYWKYNDKERVDGQEFCILELINFTFKQLDENINKCIAKAKELYYKKSGVTEPIHKDEIKNLKKSMKSFMDDVINQFKGKGIDYEICTIRKSNRSKKSKANRTKNRRGNRSAS
jgi:hypothetical protein